MNNLMKKAKVTISFLLCFSLSVFAAADPNSTPQKTAKQIFEEASTLYKQNHHDPKVKVLLEEAREMLLAKEDLNKREEETFRKINSLLYWTIKFTPRDKNKPRPKKKPRKAVAGKPQEKIPEFKNEYERGLWEAQKYEKEHPNDHYNNLLNYLQVIDYIKTYKQAKKIVEKTSEFYSKYNAGVKDALSSELNKIRGYKDSNYRDKTNKLGLFIKSKKDKYSENMLALLRKEYFKMKVLRDVKRELLSREDFEGLSYKSGKDEGSIGNVTSEGIEVYLSGGMGMRTVRWKNVDEMAMLNLGEKVLGSKSKSLDLAFVHLNLCNFVEAFKLFDDMVNANKQELFKYSYYMEECENAFSSKFGELLIEEVTIAKKMAAAGQKTKGLQKITSFYDNFIAAGGKLSYRLVPLYNTAKHEIGSI